MHNFIIPCSPSHVIVPKYCHVGESLSLIVSIFFSILNIQHTAGLLLLYVAVNNKSFARCGNAFNIVAQVHECILTHLGVHV